MKSANEQPVGKEASEVGFLEIAVLVLSIYVLTALAVQLAVQLPPPANALLDKIDVFVCLVFFAESLVRFWRAPSKLAFLRWGWIDLIASIPTVDWLRWGRLVRMVRIIRLLRAFRSARHLITFLYRNRARSLTGTAVLAGMVIVILCSIAVLLLETDARSNIKTPFDAIWWAFSTMTTVGYGDKYPVTTEGRLVAIVLMVTGVGLFGVLTGLFARLFVEPELKKEESDLGKLAAEVRLLRERIDHMQHGDAAPLAHRPSPPLVQEE